MDNAEKKDRALVEDIVVGVVCIIWRLIHATDAPAALKKEAEKLAAVVYDFSDE